MADDGLWLSISALAKRKGVTKQTISERVTALETAGKIETRRGEHRAKLVNVAQYDLAVGEVTDLSKEQAADTARLTRPDELPLIEPAPRGPSEFTQAQTSRALYDTELKKLELGERRGLLVAIVKLTEAINRAADAIVQVIDRLPLFAAEVAAAVAKDGEAGARTILKTIALALRAEITKALRGIEGEGIAEEANGPITVEVPDQAAS